MEWCSSIRQSWGTDLLSAAPDPAKLPLPDGVTRHPEDDRIFIVAKAESLAATLERTDKKAVIWKRPLDQDVINAAHALTPDQLRGLRDYQRTMLNFKNGELVHGAPDENSTGRPTAGLDQMPSPILQYTLDLVQQLQPLTPAGMSGKLRAMFTTHAPGDEHLFDESVQTSHMDRNFIRRAVVIVDGAGMKYAVGEIQRGWIGKNGRLKDEFHEAVTLRSTEPGDVIFFGGVRDDFSNFENALLHNEPGRIPGANRTGIICTYL